MVHPVGSYNFIKGKKKEKLLCDAKNMNHEQSGKMEVRNLVKMLNKYEVLLDA